MIVHVTPADEWRSTQRAAARAGCHVTSMAPGPTAHGTRMMGHVECPDGWAAARMLVAQAAEDAKTPGMRDLALMLRKQAPGDAAFARAIHAWVKQNVRFVNEAGEVFQGPGYTLASGAGDCDDHARLVMGLALAGGLPARGAFLYSEEGSDPSHALAMLCPDRSACDWAETTVDAAYGEHPLAAASRLGLLHNRKDLQQKVRTMSESELPPIPSDYLEKNPPNVTAADSATLAALGYLEAGQVTSDPTDPVFRQAILAFQIAHPWLLKDGLSGEHTRAALANESPTTERATMGALTTGLTSYLSDAFFSQLAAWVRDKRAKGMRANGADFLAAWMNESTVRPDTKNSLGYAGLNGMGEQERKSVGFTGTIDDWTALTAEQQLPYVLRYYEQDVASFAGGNWAALHDAGALYLLGYLPAYIGHANDPSFVLVTKANDPHGWYSQNTGLDIGQKGWIEVGDMAKTVSRAVASLPAKWKELAARMAAAGDAPSLDQPWGLSPIVAVSVVVGAAAIGSMLAEWLRA